MVISRVVLILIMVLYLQDVFAQASSRRSGGQPTGGHSQKAEKPTDAEMHTQSSSRRSGGQPSGGRSSKAKRPTEAEMYARAKANSEAFYNQQVEMHINSRQILIDNYVLKEKLTFMDEHEREPIEEEYEEIRFKAALKADEEIAFAIDVTRKGVDENLAKYAAYQADVKKQRADKLANLLAAHEARKLPEDFHQMYVVLNNGMVLRMFKQASPSYPYKLYVEKLSGLAQEMGIKENALFGRARYNVRKGTFEYQTVVDYTHAFDIPLNFELVKQGCGTIFDSNDLSFSIQAPDTEDLATDGSVEQWRAPGQGSVCPYIEMDYANCRVKRCLKRTSLNLDATLMPANATKRAYTLGKQYFAEAKKVRKSYAEHQADLQEIVTKINQKTKREKRQAARAKCPRALCEETVINQFIIDQAWGRSPNEKPVW
mgnify:CR=1 FL=1